MTTYYMRADGSAANKAAATSDGAANTSMDVTVHNGETFSAGDIITVSDAGGNYTAMIQPPSAGSSGSPITYMGSGTPTLAGVIATAFRIIAAKNYISIDGLTFSGWTGRGIYNTNALGTVVRNCTFTGGGNDVVPDHAIQIQETNSTLITGIDIRNNTFGLQGSSESDNIGVNSIMLQGCSAAVIASNTFNNTNHRAITIYTGTGKRSTGCIVEDNEIYGCFSGIQLQEADNCIVRYNIVRDGKGLGIGVAGACDGSELYYNLIYNLAKGTALWNGIDISGSSIDGTCYNNTVYKVHRHCFMLDDPSSGWLIKNNIFDASQNTTTAEGGVALKVCIGVRDSGLAFTSDYNLLIAPEESGVNIVPNASFETFVGTEDDGTTDTFTGWSMTGADGSNKFEAVTTADAGISSIPDGEPLSIR